MRESLVACKSPDEFSSSFSSERNISKPIRSHGVENISQTLKDAESNLGSTIISDVCHCKATVYLPNLCMVRMTSGGKPSIICLHLQEKLIASTVT